LTIPKQDMLSDLSIVLAQPADSENYLDLLEEIAEWLHTRGVGKVPPGTYRQFAAYYADSITAGEVYFGVIDGRVVGSFRIVHDDETVWPGVDPDGLSVENLVVRRAWNGHGIGLRLLKWAEQKVAEAGMKYIRLDCFADNPVLRKYYEALGYEGCGGIDASYPFGSLRLQRYQKAL
jgi:GNAT superfamily N-acetyltransferase